MKLNVKTDFGPGVIKTFSGKFFDVTNPNSELIDIRDIAHSLSNLCRFGGHTRRFYSVAEHSLRVAAYAAPEHKLAALLHDASEAYLTDLPRPVKALFPEYVKIENNLQKVIAEKFGFGYPYHKSISELDELVLKLEYKEMMNNLILDVKPMPPETAREEFIQAFIEFILVKEKLLTFNSNSTILK